MSMSKQQSQKQLQEQTARGNQHDTLERAGATQVQNQHSVGQGQTTPPDQDAVQIRDGFARIAEENEKGVQG